MGELALVLVGGRAGQLSLQGVGDLRVIRAADAADPGTTSLAPGSSAVLVAWVDDPALVPVLRAWADEHDVAVVLGGDPDPLDPSQVEANHGVVAQLLRDAKVRGVWLAVDPDRLVEVAADAVARSSAAEPLATDTVDLAEALGSRAGPLPVPASLGVVFRRLTRVPVGRAEGLGRLLVLAACERALQELCLEEPVLDGRGRGEEERAARDRLPPVEVADWVSERITQVLDGVVLQGDEPLVDQIDRLLRPVATEIERLCGAIGEAERSRLSPMRAFTACGIRQTVEALDVEIRAVELGYPSDRLRALACLLDGTPMVEGEHDAVPLTAWRRLFAGVPSEVQAAGAPGRGVARGLVRERLEHFRSAYARAVSGHLRVLVARAHEPSAPPSTMELEVLKLRAERVDDGLRRVLDGFADRIRSEARSAIRGDRLVRWATPDADALAASLREGCGAFEVFGHTRRVFRERLVQAQVGRLGDRPFEEALQALVDALSATPDEAAAPDYDDVLFSLVRERDPTDLRNDLAPSPQGTMRLRLQSPANAALGGWLARGMGVAIAPGIPTHAVCDAPERALGLRHGPRNRRATGEHRPSDLLLPPPMGDTAAGLAAIVRAANGLLVGLCTGVLSLEACDGDRPSWWVVGLGLQGSEQWRLPVEATAVLAHHDAVLQGLEVRIQARLSALGVDPRAGIVVRRLHELAVLGPSAELLQFLGMVGRLEPLATGPLRALLRRQADEAVAVMVDAMHSSELAVWMRAPRERSLVRLGALVEGAV